MGENLGLIGLILFTLVIASVFYYLSGQYVIALALLIGLFPVVMSAASKKR
ncbi:MAG: hypothetical protein KF799_03830 [Bdellovibrionales bacterium]|nr:hypothetical protein [Bdellovibrionales bacterium]